MPDDDADLDDETGGEDDDKAKGKKKQDDLVPRAEINRIAAREKRAGNRQGRIDLLEELEIASETELKKLVDLARSGKKEQSQELQDAINERDNARAELKKLKDGENQRTLSDRIFDELCEQGLKPKAARRAVKLVELDDPKAVDDEVVGAVADLMKEMPQLFAASNEGTEGEDGDANGSGSQGTPPPPRSDVGKPPAKKGKGEPTSAEKAKARLVRDLPEVFNPDGTRRDSGPGSGMTPLTYERT